jgi:hypothetical protein
MCAVLPDFVSLTFGGKMKTIRYRKLLPLIFLILIILFSNACSNLSNIAPPTITPSQVDQVISGSETMDYIVAHSMKELVDKSTIIVSGQASALKEVINMARDVNDINKPDPNLLGVGQVYQFEVDQYIKGNGPKTIYVVQPEGFLPGDQVGLNLVDANIKKARSQEIYIPIRLNNPYILFLVSLNGFLSSKNYYTGPMLPWRFDISNPDEVIPESPWTGALQAFPPRKASVLLNQIASPELALTSNPPTSYPGPTSYP